MPSRDAMWSAALAQLAMAERLRQEAFAPPRLGGEPPVDVLETEAGLLVVVALPGVARDDMESSSAVATACPWHAPLARRHAPGPRAPAGTAARSFRAEIAAAARRLSTRPPGAHRWLPGPNVAEARLMDTPVIHLGDAASADTLVLVPVTDTVLLPGVCATSDHRQPRRRGRAAGSARRAPRDRVRGNAQSLPTHP